MNAGTDGNINIGLNLTTDKFVRQLGNIQKMSAKAGKLIAASFVTKAVVNFSKECLALGSDLTEVQNVVDTTFTTMNGKVNQFAQEAFKNYGLSETMAKKYSGTFGAMAKAFNFSESEAYKMSSSLTGLAGDVASFYNISQDEAYTKLKSVFTGETESLKELGVVMTQSALDQYALANGFGKTTSAMTEQEKVALRYSFVQNQLTAAAGDFAKTSGSWANQVRMLSLQFESLKASIGQGLINILTPVIRWLNLLMEKLVAVANAFRDFTATLFGKQSTQKTQITTTSDGLGSVTTEANNATAATNKSTEAAKKLKRELAGFDQITKLGSEESSSDSANSPSSPSPSTTTSTPTTGLPAESDVLTLAERYEKLAASIANLKDKFKTFTDLLSGAGKWVYDNVLKPLGQWTMNELLPAFLDVFASALEVLTSVCNLLKPAWQWLWDNLFSKIAAFVGDAIIIFLQEFAGQLSMLADGFRGLGEMIQGIPGKIDSIKASVKQKWSEVKAGVTGKIVEFKANVATKWSDLKKEWNELKAKVTGKTASMKAKIATEWSDLKKKWSKITVNIKNKTASFAGKVTSTASTIKKAWEKIAAEWKNKTAKFSLKFSAATSDLKAWVNTNVIDKINTKFKDVPILKNHLIPHLAQGGFVKKNTPQLAMIGDNRHYGEIVAPENKLEEMARMAAAGAMGTSPEVIALLKEIIELLKNLDLDVVVDGKSLMNLIVRLINRQTNSTGTCPIKV